MEKVKRGRGQPPREFSPKDREEIEHLAGLCMSHEEIAQLKKCDRHTLEKHCSQELADGKAKSKQMVLNNFFTNIKKGSEASIFFYLKTQHNWREKSAVEVSGVDGAPLTPTINLSIAGKK